MIAVSVILTSFSIIRIKIQEFCLRANYQALTSVKLDGMIFFEASSELSIKKGRRVVVLWSIYFIVASVKKT